MAEDAVITGAQDKTRQRQQPAIKRAVVTTVVAAIKAEAVRVAIRTAAARVLIRLAAARGVRGLPQMPMLLPTIRQKQKINRRQRPAFRVPVAED